MNCMRLFIAKKFFLEELLFLFILRPWAEMCRPFGNFFRQSSQNSNLCVQTTILNIIDYLLEKNLFESNFSFSETLFRFWGKKVQHGGKILGNLVFFPKKCTFYQFWPKIEFFSAVWLKWLGIIAKALFYVSRKNNWEKKLFEICFMCFLFEISESSPEVFGLFVKTFFRFSKLFSMSPKNTFEDFF